MANDRILCPECQTPISMYAKSCKCGWSNSPTVRSMEGERSDALVAAARAHYLASAPKMTDQQWYNVCKFWPFVAAHVNRPRPEVGPSHPLDATARQGPMFRKRRLLDAEEVAEREAVQADA